MSFAENDYPDWLYRDLLEDTLPWEKAVEQTFGRFQERYSLHDSYWLCALCGLGFGDSVTLCIEWDPYWLPEGMVEPTPIVANWPILLIRFHGVREIGHVQSKYVPGVSGTIADSTTSESIAGHEVIINDIGGGAVKISFTGSVRFLALTRNREALTL